MIFRWPVHAQPSRLAFVLSESGRVIWFKLAADRRTILSYGYVREG